MLPTIRLRRITITADQDSAMKQEIKGIGVGEWQPYERDREIAEIVGVRTAHTMNRTKEAFRLIVQRWPKVQVLQPKDSTRTRTVIT